MSKTQPLLASPASPAAAGQATRPIQRTPIIPSRAPQPGTQQHSIDDVPMPLLWAACGISAVALLIQIWNYFAS
jgi:hypothetical protein